MKRFVAMLVLLAAAPAMATDVSSTKSKPGGASTGPSGGSSAGASSLTESMLLNPTSLGNVSVASDYGFLKAISGKPSLQWWHLDFAVEYHHLLIQNDLEGMAAEKNLLYYQLNAYFDLTGFDRIYVRAGMYEHFLADQGETGIRAEDPRFGYQRLVLLPWQLYLRLVGYLTAPASFESYLESLYTEPTAEIVIGRKFGDFSIELEGVGHFYWTKYSTYGTTQNFTGGSPNPQFSAGYLVDLEYALPIPGLNKGLVIGIDFSTEYYWYYQVQPAANDPSLGPGIIPPVQATGIKQPVQQEYDDEIYLRYSMPPINGFGADLLVSFANGDPTLGDPSLLHSGVDRFYLFWRQNAEFYTALTLHY